MHSLLMVLVPPALGIAVGIAISVAWGMFRSRKPSKRVAELLLANDQLTEANNRLAEEALTDPLTGALNRRFLTAHLARESARILRLFESRDTRTSGNVLLVVDIDDFKHVNDRHGHVQGDQALVQFAEILKRAVRDSDYVVRWGGEEFVVLATDARAEDGAIIADRILESVRKHRVLGEHGAAMTCSIGVSHFPFFPDHARALDWQQVLQVADLSAYLAKHNGKDGWFSLRGQRFEAGFRFERLREKMTGVPDALHLDETLVVESSAGGPQEFAAAVNQAG